LRLGRSLALPERPRFAIWLRFPALYYYPAFSIASSGIDSDPERTTAPVAPWLRYVVFGKGGFDRKGAETHREGKE
ncbi:MAG: hypothetical protein BECKG1743E_GA0114224_110934, partial [Candidatus Kentron sp. G]